MEGTRSTLAALEALREMGVGLAIDDFGTGYSSLGYLKRFRVDVLKVDRCFVEGLGHSQEDAAIAQTVIDLAHNMNLAAIAEGVESKYQLDELSGMGCDVAQGYHFGPPQPPEALNEMLST